jgi:hypothetical protein
MRILSITNIKSTIELHRVDLQDIQLELEDELKQNDYIYQLYHKSDRILSYRIFKNTYKSFLHLEQSQIKSTGLEINVDYKNQNINPSLTTTINRKSNSKGLFSRYYIFFILFALLYSASGWISSLFFQINYSIQEQLLFSFLLFLGIAVIWLVIIPRFRKYREKSFKNEDQTVLNLIFNRLKKYNLNISEKQVKRCWSCFNEIQPEENHCSSCGTLINPNS